MAGIATVISTPPPLVMWCGPVPIGSPYEEAVVVPLVPKVKVLTLKCNDISNNSCEMRVSFQL